MSEKYYRKKGQHWLFWNPNFRVESDRVNYIRILIAVKLWEGDLIAETNVIFTALRFGQNFHSEAVNFILTRQLWSSPFCYRHTDLLLCRPSRHNNISPTSHWCVISVQVATKQLLPKPIIIMAADFCMLGINILEVVQDWRAPLCFKRFENWSTQRGRGWKWKALLEAVLKQSVDIFSTFHAVQFSKTVPS